MMKQATVNLNFPSEKRMKIVLHALRPETRISSTGRSKVHVEGEGKRLTLIFKARDTSALRAALNSYLRWIVVINDTCTVIEAYKKASVSIPLTKHFKSNATLKPASI